MNKEVRVSEIQIVPIKPKDGLVGFASFVLEDKYYVGSVAIYTKADGSGYRLLYPAKKLGERSINVFHPITSWAGKIIEEAVTKKVSEIFSDVSNENYDKLSERLYR